MARSGEKMRCHEALRSANCLRLAEFLRFSFHGTGIPPYRAGEAGNGRDVPHDVMAAVMIKP
ncbi:MAG: hypothetical protein PHP23_13700 [Desulfobacterales bacterium]|nr:hypothetical protein [Desulfobacterales bacterium]MDD4071642.1 hypothetical protein [Desulfobacterales bacterium]MDD4391642.1 hypothetical protein [Desulfobacterales bacterium]